MCVWVCVCVLSHCDPLEDNPSRESTGTNPGKISPTILLNFPYSLYFLPPGPALPAPCAPLALSLWVNQSRPVSVLLLSAFLMGVGVTRLCELFPADVCFSIYLRFEMTETRWSVRELWVGPLSSPALLSELVLQQRLERTLKHCCG